VRSGAEDLKSGARFAARRVRWVALAIGVATLAGAYSQWIIMPWAPPLLFPLLAVLGAELVAWFAVHSLVRAVQGARRGERIPVLSVAVSVAAVTLLVILPLTRLVAMLRPSGGGAPRILSGFGDWLGAEGYPRVNGRHSGVDLAGRMGSLVLAPADGRVIVAEDNHNSCGLIVVLDHGVQGYRTIHCHLSAISVKRGEDVKRGDRIGAIGTSGMRAWPGYEHVHWERQKGKGGPYEDPVSKTMGCFDATRLYPTNRLVLTYPVKC